ncbi:MAG: hypothetical protein AAFR47_12280, partial [Pseudomonadota bacterium]
DLTLWQIFALRGVLALPMLLVLLWLRGAHRGVLRIALGVWPLLRAVFITTTFLAFYAAIPFLSLSTVGAANYIAPIFVAQPSARSDRFSDRVRRQQGHEDRRDVVCCANG